MVNNSVARRRNAVLFIKWVRDMADRQDRVVWCLSIIALYLALLMMTLLWAKHMLMVLRPHEKNDHDSLSLETLVSSIALSPIIGSQATRWLPASFEGVDVTVLKWIAAEARRMSQRFILTWSHACCQSFNLPARCERES
jgi:hypothetical protein